MQGTSANDLPYFHRKRRPLSRLVAAVLDDDACGGFGVNFPAVDPVESRDTMSLELAKLVLV